MSKKVVNKKKKIRMEVRLDESMYDKIKKEAAKEDISMSEFTRQLFDLYFN